jgi:hypothetical protein
MSGPAASHLCYKGPASSRFQPVGRPICIANSMRAVSVGWVGLAST